MVMRLFSIQVLQAQQRARCHCARTQFEAHTSDLHDEGSHAAAAKV
jgi:hypothetical protein